MKLFTSYLIECFKLESVRSSVNRTKHYSQDSMYCCFLDSKKSSTASIVFSVRYSSNLSPYLMKYLNFTFIFMS